MTHNNELQAALLGLIDSLLTECDGETGCARDSFSPSAFSLSLRSKTFMKSIPSLSLASPSPSLCLLRCHTELIALFHTFPDPLALSLPFLLSFSHTNTRTYQNHTLYLKDVAEFLIYLERRLILKTARRSLHSPLYGGGKFDLTGGLSGRRTCVLTAGVTG